MAKLYKITTVILLVCGGCFFAFADRGGYIRKDKPHLNITTNGDLKNSIQFNLRSGLTYRSSFLLNTQKVEGGMVNDVYITYKKGNTTYILPYKQKVLVPQYSQKEGYKLIIRSRK